MQLQFLGAKPLFEAISTTQHLNGKKLDVRYL